MKERNFFDKPEHRKALWRAFVGSLVLLVLADFVLERHGSHWWERIPVFFGLYGFIGCALLVLIAKRLRSVLKRDEDYYE
jgi:hypothetical protein